MLDDDFIWCPVTVIKVEKDHMVTVHFEGWDSSFNQHLSWSSERLAPLYAFTKSVKCLAEVLPKKRGHSNLWPCKVQFRMPHPVIEDAKNEDNCLNATKFLREEPNVYIQPYSIKSLPISYIRNGLDRDGGMWLNAKQLKVWREDLSELGDISDGFERAFEMATKDVETVGTLPANAIERGCLLKEFYQVNSREGAQVRDGAIRATFVARDDEGKASSPAHVRDTIMEEQNSTTSAGKNRAKENAEEQPVKPASRQKTDDSHSLDENNDAQSDAEEVDISNDEDWADKKPPAKKSTKKAT